MATINRSNVRKADRFTIDGRDSGGEEILNTISGRDTPASKLTTEWVSLSSLLPDPENPRKLHLDTKSLLEDPATIEDERRSLVLTKIRSLAESIARDGLSNPIEVYSVPGGGYRIISGERRYWACMYNLLTASEDKKRNVEEVRVTVYKNRPNRVRNKQLSENVLRDDLTLADQMHSIKAAFEEAVSQSEVAITTVKSFADELKLVYHDARVWYWLLTKGESVIPLVAGEKVTAVNQLRILKDLDDAQLKKAVPKIAQYGFSQDNIDSLVSDADQASVSKPAKNPLGGRPKAYFTTAKVTPNAARQIYEALSPILNLSTVNWSDQDASRKAFESLIKSLNGSR